MFLPSVNYWTTIQDASAMKRICTAAGIDNIPVNYTTSSKAFVSHIAVSGKENAIMFLPSSVCIGVRHLAICEQDSEYIFKDLINAPPLLDKTVNSIVGGLCIMLITTSIIPAKLLRGFRYKAYKYFCKFVTCNDKMDTIMWVIGNTILDPSNIAKCLIFIGPSGSGKSTLMTYITDALGMCADIVHTSSLYGNHVLDIDNIGKACSRQLLICNNVDFNQNQLNIQNYKLILEHDFLLAEPTKCKAMCSMMIGCDSLPDPSVIKQWTTTAILQQSVVVPFYTNIGEYISKYSAPSMPQDKLDFCLKALETRLVLSTLPTTTRSVLLTVCGHCYTSLKEIVRMKHDASQAECICASSMVAGCLGISHNDLGDMAKAVCSTSVFREGRSYFLNRICPA